MSAIINANGLSEYGLELPKVWVRQGEWIAMPLRGATDAGLGFVQKKKGDI